MYSPLSFVCPTCGETFVLKGYKLRKWVTDKKRNPARTGPYCNHVCAGRFNIKAAHRVQRAKLREPSSSASSTLVNAVDS